MKPAALNLILLLALFFSQGCAPPVEDVASEADFEKWYPEYNRYVRNWLNKQVEDIGTETKKLQEEYSNAKDA